MLEGEAIAVSVNGFFMVKWKHGSMPRDQK